MDPTSWAALSGAIEAGLSTTQAVDRIVAHDGSAIVGSALLFPPAADAYGGLTTSFKLPEVRLVSVEPAARGRGIARALMQECFHRAKAAGATHIGLHTSRSMGAAVRMYERMGFERVPENDFQPPGTELVVGYQLRLE
jgi:GNAT superfamily N-acetyltransferase